MRIFKPSLGAYIADYILQDTSALIAHEALTKMIGNAIIDAHNVPDNRLPDAVADDLARQEVCTKDAALNAISKAIDDYTNIDRALKELCDAKRIVYWYDDDECANYALLECEEPLQVEHMQDASKVLKHMAMQRTVRMASAGWYRITCEARSLANQFGKHTTDAVNIYADSIIKGICTVANRLGMSDLSEGKKADTAPQSDIGAAGDYFDGF